VSERSNRNTGKTSIMLHRAIADVLGGTDVMVIAANRAQAGQMLRRVAEMQTPEKISGQKLTLEYKAARMVFVANRRDRQHERGWSGKIVTDHFVIESGG
jgi:hypothetical protein